MLITTLFSDKDMESFENDPYEECWDHIRLKERIRKTLHYGKTPKMDRGSFPLTEMAVEYFQDHAPRELGKVDMYWASTVSRRAAISPCSMMLGMLYLERLQNKDQNYLREVSSSDLFLISMMVASKYLYDEGITEEVFNDEWAESANLDIDDLNQLEREFLSAIDWNLFVSAEDFWKTLQSIEERIAEREGLQRGSLMYSDLMVLLCNPRLTSLCWNVLQQFCKVALVCSVAYVAGLTTLMLSPVALTLVKTQLQLVATRVDTDSKINESSIPSRPQMQQATSYLDVKAATSTEPEVESQGFDVPNANILLGKAEIEAITYPRRAHGIGDHRVHARMSSPIQMSLPLQGFLTLALLKDTVVQAVRSVAEKIRRPLFNDKSPRQSEIHAKENCSCGVPIPPSCCTNDTESRIPPVIHGSNCNCFAKQATETEIRPDSSTSYCKCNDIGSSSDLEKKTSKHVDYLTNRNLIECTRSSYVGKESLKRIEMHCEWSMQDAFSDTIGFWTNVPPIAA